MNEFFVLYKQRIIFACIVILAIGGIAFYVIKKQSDDAHKPIVSSVGEGTLVPAVTQTQNQIQAPSDQEYLTMFTATTTGIPTPGIVGVATPLAGWYVVTFSIRGTDTPVKVVFVASSNANNPLTIAYNPLTQPLAALMALPAQVQKAARS